MVSLEPPRRDQVLRPWGWAVSLSALRDALSRSPTPGVWSDVAITRHRGDYTPDAGANRPEALGRSRCSRRHNPDDLLGHLGAVREQVGIGLARYWITSPAIVFPAGALIGSGRCGSLLDNARKHTMTTLLAVLEFTDYAFIAAIVAIFTGGAAYVRRREIDLQPLERELSRVQQKLDALMEHQGIDLPSRPPSGLSPEVERLARDPSSKIAAIKLYREQHPGVGLAEAKAKIEAFYSGRS